MHINLSNIELVANKCTDFNAKWIAVTKMRSVETLKELYSNGIKIFGENKAQELSEKYTQFPNDIEWHFIGHLQTNKVRDIIDKVSYIHAVDSLKLLQTIQKEAAKIDKTINVFIQVYVAKEETKYGFNPDECLAFFKEINDSNFPNINIVGLMAMASFTDNQAQIREEFMQVKSTYDSINKISKFNLTELSMGMSGDYEIALECGSTVVRVGSVLYN
jgi:PLP dependent protein